MAYRVVGMHAPIGLLSYIDATIELKKNILLIQSNIMDPAVKPQQ